MFKKIENHEIVAYKTIRMTMEESSHVIEGVIDSMFHYSPMVIALESDGVIHIKFKCTKKKFESLEKILYSLRQTAKLGVMTLV